LKLSEAILKLRACGIIVSDIPIMSKAQKKFFIEYKNPSSTNTPPLKRSYYSPDPEFTNSMLDHIGKYLELKDDWYL